MFNIEDLLQEELLEDLAFEYLNEAKGSARQRKKVARRVPLSVEYKGKRVNKNVYLRRKKTPKDYSVTIQKPGRKGLTGRNDLEKQNYRIEPGEKKLMISGTTHGKGRSEQWSTDHDHIIKKYNITQNDINNMKPGESRKVRTRSNGNSFVLAGKIKNSFKNAKVPTSWGKTLNANNGKYNHHLVAYNGNKKDLGAVENKIMKTTYKEEMDLLFDLYNDDIL